MKSWQIFAVGVAVLIAALFLPVYESLLAGIAAIALVIAVAAGFALRPRQEVFYLRTTLVRERNHAVSVEHDRIAVRLELARLWLLFLPTFGALAFLVVTSAKGTTWKFSILGKALEQFSYPLLLVIRLFMVAVVGILSTWLSERWVLRDADACSADTVSGLAGRVLYSFRDRSGEYYGGECFPFALESSKLGRLVFYNLRKPHLNKIMMGCLFHRVLIVGRGLTELDEQTVASRIRQAQPAAQGG